MVEIDWPTKFGTWFNQYEEAADNGDDRAKLILGYVDQALKLLTDLTEAPTEETASLKPVSQSGGRYSRYQVWRISHPYDRKVAVRVICWFPPKADTVIVALFAGDKAKAGNIWYDTVGRQADLLIDTWKEETGYDNE